MIRAEVKDSHGGAGAHVGAGGKVGEANGVRGGGLQLKGGGVFRGEAAKVGSAGWLFSAKTRDTNKEETKSRLQKNKNNKTSRTDSAAASGQKCGQQTALGRRTCARAGRWPGGAMKGASWTG